MITKYRKRTVAICLKSLPVRLKHIPVWRAAELLISIGYEKTQLKWVSKRDGKRRFNWTAAQFQHASQLTDEQATSIHIIEFSGGPPGSTQIYKGTLLTFLIDCLLRMVLSGGFRSLDDALPLQESYR